MITPVSKDQAAVEVAKMLEGSKTHEKIISHLTESGDRGENTSGLIKCTNIAHLCSSESQKHGLNPAAVIEKLRRVHRVGGRFFVEEYSKYLRTCRL